MVSSRTASRLLRTKIGGRIMGLGLAGLAEEVSRHEMILPSRRHRLRRVRIAALKSVLATIRLDLAGDAPHRFVLPVNVLRQVGSLGLGRIAVVDYAYRADQLTTYRWIATNATACGGSKVVNSWPSISTNKSRDQVLADGHEWVAVRIGMGEDDSRAATRNEAPQCHPSPHGRLP